MAFEFFRRRQKMVIIIMVVLMLSFLIGAQAFQAIFRPSAGNEVFGKFPDGRKLKRSDARRAARDIEVIRMVLRTPMLRFPEPLRLEMDAILNNGVLAPYAYAILLDEAKDLPSFRTEDILGTLEYLGYTGDRYRRLLSDLRAQEITEEDLHGAVARLLGVRAAHGQLTVQSFPSMPRVFQEVLNQYEKVDLQIAVVPVEAFAPADVELSEEDITAQFEQYRDAPRHRVSEENRFGFGYRYQDRLAVDYVLIRRDLLTAAETITDEEAAGHYSRHKNDSDFLSSLGLSAEDIEGELKFSTVRDAIVALLTDRAVDAKSSVLAGELARQCRPTAAADGNHVFGAAVAAMILAADDILATPLTDIDGGSIALAEALAQLSTAASIEAVSFPYSDDILPETTVRLSLADGTLGGALADLCEQVGLPELIWVRCRGMGQRGDVLFADGAVSTLPVRIGRTGLVSQIEAQRDPALADAATAGQESMTLLELAFTGDHFRSREQATTVVTMPQPRMQVPGIQGGEIVWRIVQAKPSEAPEELTDELRQLVIEDLLTSRATTAALDAAKELADQAATSPLADLAESSGYEVLTTGLITRRANDIPGLVIQQPIMRSELLTEAFLMARRRPTRTGPEELQLAPADEEVGVIDLPAEGMICIFRVLDHVLPTDQERAQGYANAIERIQVLQGHVTLMQWLAWDEILKRTGFEPRRNEDQAPQS